MALINRLHPPSSQQASSCNVLSYVIEVTYKNVKAWQYLQPVVPRENFRYLNDVWWWGLGFANLTLQPLKRPHCKDVCI